MKKIIIMFLTLVLLTGCTKVNDFSYNDMLQIFAGKTIRVNTYRTGYKYYLPQGMQITNSKLYNEVIEDAYYKYYLYVDIVSYYNKVSKNYEINNDAVFSNTLSYDGKNGYLEINLIENNKYLVEIMYNYAKIEVIVDSKDSKGAVLSAINILKSIEYNDSIIENLLGDDVLNFYEEEFDIFNVKGKDSNLIYNNDSNQTVEDKIPDADLIN